jgi:hypothetical protein
MEWGKVRQSAQALLHLGVKHHCFGELRPAVNDPMTDGVYWA